MASVLQWLAATAGWTLSQNYPPPTIKSWWTILITPMRNNLPMLYCKKNGLWPHDSFWLFCFVFNDNFFTTNSEGQLSTEGGKAARVIFYRCLYSQLVLLCHVVRVQQPSPPLPPPQQHLRTSAGRINSQAYNCCYMLFFQGKRALFFVDITQDEEAYTL